MQAVQAVDKKRGQKPAAEHDDPMDDPGDAREPEVLKFTINVATTDGAAAERQVVELQGRSRR